MGERSEYMNSEELKSIIESAREAKRISQRELAKLSGISRSTLNDIINGKIKKIKLDDLYQISNILEINLENLLEACGFKSVLKSLNADRYAGLSDRQLKEKIDEYQQSELNLLDWDAKKRKRCREVVSKLFAIQNKIEWDKSTSKKYTKEDISKDIQEVIDELKLIQEKYDYSKLPKK